MKNMSRLKLVPRKGLKKLLRVQVVLEMIYQLTSLEAHGGSRHQTHQKGHEMGTFRSRELNKVDHYMSMRE